MRLKDKIIIITGAGSGIGKSTAALFASEGATVIIADVQEDSGKAAVTEIEATGGNAMFIPCDVTDASSTTVMADQVFNTFGRIDVLFNNAGISGVGAVHEVSEEVWERVMRVNVTGVFLTCKAVLPYMMKTKKGSIINMSSGIAEIGVAERASYSASKGAVLSLTKAMQVDYAPYGIRVNALLPGTIMTPFVEGYLKTSLDPEASVAAIKRRQLSGELGKPEDVARAALFLASDESGFVMGSPLYVDGGLVFGKNA
ncbi:short-chain dehydrogenase [Paenibacillus odorifer]|uniref:Short-chain dehydrogenase n=1 Tax=Paenibacillus odorifer TaxID=189426 RepID=A0A1R0ZQ05_9BACL|nr:SDR family NAD(P)-dependent oxidoreductase [Paenibacillus odorifer]OMD54706.1 short-chain dehydrogenase [Paenibacillus odorifer]OME74719.1 short-chain dehydrogenase [Paenibacillus odorifer]